MADFRAAAVRHFSDGDVLCAASRYANASQLWAYGAECTLKAILLKMGHLKLDAKGKPDKDAHRKHINDPGNPLIGAYISTLGGHTDYALPNRASWFEAWNINQRYESGAAVAAAHVAHRGDKQVFARLLGKAHENGHA